MRILEVSRGPVAVVADVGGRPRRSAIVKRPVAGRVPVGPLGLEGDAQHNRKYHGGPHQAVYAYAAEDAAWWTGELGLTVDASVLGQNLTTQGIDTAGVVIGERWRVGTTLLEATSPRIPCATLARRASEPRMVRRFGKAGRPGVYFRVLEPGTVGAGDAVTVTARPTGAPTIAAVMALVLYDGARVGELLEVPGVNPAIAVWARENLPVSARATST